MYETPPYCISLVPTTRCNLNCKYCYIGKQHDTYRSIEESIVKTFDTPRYYLDMAKRLLPDIEERGVEELQFWGGEALLFIKRAFPAIIDFANEYPMLNTFMLSTNFTHDGAVNKVMALANTLSTLDRTTVLKIQLSLDGPHEINDANRGVGSTDKLIKNLRLFSKITCPKNVIISTHFKATLSAEDFKTLSDFEQCKRYMTFFDKLYTEFKEAPGNVQIWTSGPTIVIPYQYTKEDGIYYSQMFSNMLRLRDSYANDFKALSQKDFFLYADRTNGGYDGDTYESRMRYCGLNRCLELFPDGISSVCHRCVDSIICNWDDLHSTQWDDHQLIFRTATEFTDKYSKLQDKLRLATTATSTPVVEASLTIRTLAELGEIDPKYLNPDLALQAARYIQANLPTCAEGNILLTGNINLTYIGMYRLMLNGALDLMIKDQGGRQIKC